MKKYSVEEFVELIQQASDSDGTRIVAGQGTPNPQTREGFYLGVMQGLKTTNVFIGLDKTNGEFIIESIG